MFNFIKKRFNSHFGEEEEIEFEIEPYELDGRKNRWSRKSDIEDKFLQFESLGEDMVLVSHKKEKLIMLINLYFRENYFLMDNDGGIYKIMEKGW